MFYLPRLRQMVYFSEYSTGVTLKPSAYDLRPENFPDLHIGAATIFDEDYVKKER